MSALLLLKSSDHLRAAIARSGKPYREVAADANVSLGTIGNLLTGRRIGCNTETATRLCRTLDVPVAALFATRRSCVAPGCRKTARAGVRCCSPAHEKQVAEAVRRLELEAAAATSAVPA